MFLVSNGHERQRIPEVYKVSKQKEGWPSGLRRTLGKRVMGNTIREFESLSFRHKKLRTFWQFLVKLNLFDPLFSSVEISRQAI